MFNLRLEDYSIRELEELFGLVGIQYSQETLKQSYLRVLNNVNKTALSQDFTSQTKKNTVAFLEQVYNALIKELNTKIKQLPSENMSSITQTVYPVIKNSSQSIPLPSKISDSIPGVATIGKILTLDSRFRDDFNSNTNNFMITLTEKFNNVTSISLNGFFLSNTIKHVSEEIGNSHFIIEINGARRIINLPDLQIQGFGEVSFTKIITFWQILKTRIDLLGGHFSRITILPEYLLDYRHDIFAGNLGNIPDTNDIFVGRIVVHFDTNGLNQAQYPNIDIDFSKSKDDLEDSTDFRKKAGYVLGFRKTLYESITIQSDGKLLISESLIDYHTVKYGYLILDDFQSNGESNVYSNDITYSGCKNVAASSGKILAKIDYGKSSSGTIDDRFGGCSFIRNYLGKVDLNKFKVSLIDEFGRPLDIQNGDWSFNITITQKKF